MMNESPKGKMKLGKLAMPKKKSEMEMELGGEEMPSRTRQKCQTVSAA